MVGLFIQGCVVFAGNPPDLRAWAKRNGLPPVPEQGRMAFLHGAPGQVFDGSAPEGKLVLVSSDDGQCSVVAEKILDQTGVDGLEAGFRQAELKFRLVIERDDPHQSGIHHREYLAAKDGRGWRVLLATVKDPAGGTAMLTAAPE
ncbi:MAG: NMCC_0638 family (lipo)protein [Rhodopila sp.]